MKKQKYSRNDFEHWM